MFSLLKKMTLTILLDLDDTLLKNDIHKFIGVYFSLLGEALSKVVEPPLMLQAMKAAVQTMLTKELPESTLEETFDQIFYPGIGISKKDLAETINHFYQNIFPQLQALTTSRPEAQTLVDTLVGQRANIIIATNPLFPRTAIKQRIEWAGLDSFQDRFALVTDFEQSHYSKPHPAYYAEILGRLRWPKGPVVMVGNSLEDDILPAEKLGLPTYWLTEEGPPAADFHPLSRQGAFSGILPWVEEIITQNPLPTYDSVPAILASLQATPAILDTFFRLGQHQNWNLRPGSNEWSFTEILCHLRDVDLEVNSQRIEAVANGTNPFIPGINTDTWADERNYSVEHAPTALLGFIQARTAILNRLFHLSIDTWQLPARHAIFGPTTLKELLGFIATHDRVHISQSWTTLQ